MRLSALKFLFFVTLLCFNPGLKAQESTATHHTEEKEFNAVEMIMHHISDSNEWHLWTSTDENGEEHHVSIPLPIIVWKDGSFHFFSSKKIHGHTHEGFTLNHGALVSTEGLEKAGIADLFTGLNGKFVDLSITKNVAGIFISIAFLLLIFVSASKIYSKKFLG